MYMCENSRKDKKYNLRIINKELFFLIRDAPITPLLFLSV